MFYSVVLWVANYQRLRTPAVEGRSILGKVWLGLCAKKMSTFLEEEFSLRGWVGIVLPSGLTMSDGSENVRAVLRR